MDYRKTAQEIYDHIGKKENIISAAHCATRLRLVISDNSKADKEYVENIEGVKGVFFAQGQMQIILGTGIVNKVYDEFIRIAGVSESSKEELKKVAASRANPVQRLIKTLGDIFVPIIPAIVASGFLMGIMEALNFMVNNGFLNIDTSGSIYTFAQLFSNTAYTFLPILIAYSGAKVFGANPYLGAVIGMIMIHPNLQNAWTVATEGVKATQKVWFGLYSIDMVANYAQTECQDSALAERLFPFLTIRGTAKMISFCFTHIYTVHFQTICMMFICESCKARISVGIISKHIKPCTDWKL